MRKNTLFRATHENEIKGLLVNTSTKVSRYKAKGNTQNKGVAAISVVIYKVTPSIKLHGTKLKKSNTVFSPKARMQLFHFVFPTVDSD